MIPVIAAALLTGLSAQTSDGLIGYEFTVRCAGLTQAASELEGGESARGRALYDAALYWSLAASQAADASGREPAVSDNDLTRARIRAVRQLAGGDEAAGETLRQCRARTPDLD